MCNKLPMNMNHEWWDVFLITPDIENDDRTWDVENIVLPVIVWRFHQSLISSSIVIERFLFDINVEFENIIDSSLVLSESESSKRNIKIFTNKGNGRSSIEEKCNDFKESEIENNVVSKKQGIFQWLSTIIFILRIFLLDRNIFTSNGFFVECEEPLLIISERIIDHSLCKIQRKSCANIMQIMRSCIIGGIQRYFGKKIGTKSSWLFLEQLNHGLISNLVIIEESSTPRMRLNHIMQCFSYVFKFRFYVFVYFQIFLVMKNK